MYFVRLSNRFDNMFHLENRIYPNSNIETNFHRISLNENEDFRPLIDRITAFHHIDNYLDNKEIHLIHNKLLWHKDNKNIQSTKNFYLDNKSMLMDIELFHRDIIDRLVLLNFSLDSTFVLIYRQDVLYIDRLNHKNIHLDNNFFDRNNKCQWDKDNIHRNLFSIDNRSSLQDNRIYHLDIELFSIVSTNHREKNRNKLTSKFSQNHSNNIDSIPHHIENLRDKFHFHLTNKIWHFQLDNISISIPIPMDYLTNKMMLKDNNSIQSNSMNKFSSNRIRIFR